MVTVITASPAPGNPGGPAPDAPVIEVSPDLTGLVRPGPEAAAAGFAAYMAWLEVDKPDWAAWRASLTGANAEREIRSRWRQYAFRRSDIYDHAHELRGDALYLIQQIELFTEPHEGTEFVAALHAAGVPDVTPGDEADGRSARRAPGTGRGHGLSAVTARYDRHQILLLVTSARAIRDDPPATGPYQVAEPPHEAREPRYGITRFSNGGNGRMLSAPWVVGGWSG